MERRKSVANMYGTVVECPVCMEWGYLVASNECVYCYEVATLQ